MLGRWIASSLGSGFLQHAKQTLPAESATHCRESTLT